MLLLLPFCFGDDLTKESGPKEADIQRAKRDQIVKVAIKNYLQDISQYAEMKSHQYTQRKMEKKETRMIEAFPSKIVAMHRNIG